MRIPDLPKYLLSELPKSSSKFTVQQSYQVVERLGWSFPEEVDTVMGKETGYVDWEKGIPIPLEKADMTSADEGGEKEERKKLASAPLGLKKSMENLEDPTSYARRCPFNCSVLGF